MRLSSFLQPDNTFMYPSHSWKSWIGKLKTICQTLWSDTNRIFGTFAGLPDDLDCTRTKRSSILMDMGRLREEFENLVQEFHDLNTGQNKSNKYTNIPTLLETNKYPHFKRHFWVDDVPFPVWWDMDNRFLEGTTKRFSSGGAFLQLAAWASLGYPQKSLRFGWLVGWLVDLIGSLFQVSLNPESLGLVWRILCVFNRNCEEFEKVHVGVGNAAPVLLWAYEVGLKSRKQLKQWAGGWWYMQIIGGLILVLDKCLRNVLVGAKSCQDAST